MKVLMLSTDKNVLREGSEVQERMIRYAESCDELHIIVYTISKNQELKKIGNKIFIYPTNTWFKPFYFLHAYRIGKTIMGNLITCQDPFETGLAGYLLKRKLKIPLELQIHTDFLSPYFRKESWKNSLRLLLSKFLIPKSDHLRVVSERIKNSVTVEFDYPSSKIEVRPVYMDLDKIKNAPVKSNLHKKYPNFDFIILMASRLTKEKNISLAIRALSEISKKFTKTLLLVVGEGAEQPRLEQLVKQSKLENNVRFESWTDDLASYYKTADLFLLTSNYEGYARTAVEAQAAGLPVLMTDVGVTIGEIFPVGDLKTLIEKLTNFIEK